MRTPKLHAWQVIVMPLLGLALLLGSCYKKGITDLNDSTITTKTCSDYGPVSQQPKGCITSEQLMIGGKYHINHPVTFVLGLLVFAAWGFLLYNAQKNPPTSSKQQPLTKACVGCGRQIPFADRTCDFCGTVQP